MVDQPAPASSPTVVRVIIDECLTPAAVPLLQERFGARVDVVCVGTAVARGTLDADLLAWAITEQRVIITANDKDFLNAFLRGTPKHPGLACVKDQSGKKKQLAEIEPLVGRLIAHVDCGGALAGHVFALRKSGALKAKRFP